MAGPSAHGPEDGAGGFVIGRRLAVVTALIVVLLVGSATAIAAASTSRLVRTEQELAALRSAGPASPTPAASVRPSGSSSPVPSATPDIAAAVTADLVRTCIDPLRVVAERQAARLGEADKAIAVYRSNDWDRARDGAISNYRSAYLEMKSAAETMRVRVGQAKQGLEGVSSSLPGSYDDGRALASSASSSKTRMDNEEKPASSAMDRLAKLPAAGSLAEVVAACPSAAPATPTPSGASPSGSPTAAP